MLIVTRWLTQLGAFLSDVYADRNGLGVPLPSDPRAAQAALHQLEKTLKTSGFSGSRQLSTALKSRSNQRLLRGVFGNSPFLTRTVLQTPETLIYPLLNEADEGFDQILKSISASENTTLSDFEDHIRMCRQQVSVAVALADLSSAWDVDQVVRRLSGFADVVLQQTLRSILFDAMHNGTFVPQDPLHPEIGSGLFVLGLGKLGGRELNYSSDIDVVVFFDETKLAERVKDHPNRFAVWAVKTLVHALQAVRPTGYVFRVDLRLRPDPSSTQIALSTASASRYYQEFGQNWERAAMIKARPVAGDKQCADLFLAELSKFVWRETLDFLAIEDIQAIKGQLEYHAGSQTIAFEGQNIKLGRGGIRQIEFFVQTQQLIFGGRETDLRVKGTLAALRALMQDGHINSRAFTHLTSAYRYLRQLEHRLQMIEDQQTHTMPMDHASLERVALFHGEKNVRRLKSRLLTHLSNVEQHFEHLFKGSEPVSLSQGPLVFTGVEDDPATLVTLERLGFKEGPAICDVIRQWHRGQLKATGTETERVLLTKIIPDLLVAFSESGDPDAAFLEFAELIKRLPNGARVFALFRHNQPVVAELAKLLARAPRLSKRLARFPDLVGSLVVPPDKRPLKLGPALTTDFENSVIDAQTYEDWLHKTQRWASSQRFLVSIQLLNGHLKPSTAARHYTSIAHTVLQAVYDRVWTEFVKQHGKIARTEHCVVGLGRLGSRQMTSTSDLDLVFLYRSLGRDQGQVSDGPEPLSIQNYFTHFSRKVVSALGTHSFHGQLYDVDLRLRPSGRAGPVTIEWESFYQYQHSSAETWETIALLKARPVAGVPSFKRLAQRKLQKIVGQPRTTEVLRNDVMNLKRRIDQATQKTSLWDLKYGQGGIMDIELIASGLFLSNIRKFSLGGRENTLTTLTKLRRKQLLSSIQYKDLSNLYSLLQQLSQLIHVAYETPPTSSAMTEGVKTALYRRLSFESFDSLENHLALQKAKATQHFDTLIGDAH